MAFGVAEVREWVRDPEAADGDPAVLAAAYARFETDGGVEHFREASSLERYRMLADAAQVSGAFAFLVLQAFVAFPYAAERERPTRVGVAFGHLRYPDPRACPRRVGGRVIGRLPWLTGSGIFDRVVFGFLDANGEEVRALLDAWDRPGFAHSRPMDLVAMTGTRTVTVDVDLDKLPDEVSRYPSGTMAEGDRAGYVWQTPLMAGLVWASLDREPALATRAEPLLARLEHAVEFGVEPEAGRRLRTEAAAACVDLARLAAFAQGGGTLRRGHPAERVYREALIVNLMARTPDLVAEALEGGTP